MTAKDAFQFGRMNIARLKHNLTEELPTSFACREFVLKQKDSLTREEYYILTKVLLELLEFDLKQEKSCGRGSLDMARTPIPAKPPPQSSDKNAKARPPI